MRNLRKHVLPCLMGTVLLSLGALTPALAQQSTTGPAPPPGIDRGIRTVDAVAQAITLAVPAYVWHHGCGPTAEGMVIGYWDVHGCPNLVPGDASTQTPAVNAMIADDRENPDCAAADGDHYQDYSCPLDAYPTLLPDRSQTGGAHTSNCVGDLMKTSRSSVGNYYGWSWDLDVLGAFTSYVNLVAPEYKPGGTRYPFSMFSWEAYKAQIDAGRPMVLLIDTDGNGSSDHFVTGVGYDEGSMSYGVHDTWDQNVHWYQWRGMQFGNTWGIYSITTLRVSPTTQVPVGTLRGELVACVLVSATSALLFLRARRRIMEGVTTRSGQS